MSDESPRFDLLVVPQVRDVNVGEGAAASLLQVLAVSKLLVPYEESLAEEWCEVYCKTGPASHQLFVKGSYDGEQPVFKEAVVRWGPRITSLDYGTNTSEIRFYVEIRGALFDTLQGSSIQKIHDITYIRPEVFTRPHTALPPHLEVPEDERPTDKRLKRSGGGGLAGTRVEGTLSAVPLTCEECLARVEPTAPSCPACGRTRPDIGWRPDALVGLVIDGRYKLEKRVGEGGMGTVYKAHRVGRLGGEVAVKVLPPSLSRTVAARRFEREAQVISQLSNPHIVRVYDFDQLVYPHSDQPLYYLAMELIRGNTLSSIMKAVGKVNYLWTIDVLRQTARGLDEAHKAGIVHRDLKPSNLMIVQQHGSTHVKILDFGIAALTTPPGDPSGNDLDKLTRTGYITGTPDYMAPEQALGRGAVGPPADMYSLGIIAYRMLSGTLPFEGQTTIEVLTRRVASDAPPLADACPPPMLPPAMYPIVDRLLARRQVDRYQSAAELLDDLSVFPQVESAPDVDPDPTVLERFAALTPGSFATQVSAAQDAPTGDRPTPSPLASTAASAGGGASLGLAIALAVLLLVGGGVAVWWFGLRDSGPPTAELSAPGEAAVAVGEATGEDEPVEVDVPATPVSEAEVAAAADPSVELGSVRPALDDAWTEALTVQAHGLSLVLALPRERPAAGGALKLMLAVARGETALRLAGAAAATGTSPRVESRGATERPDGRVEVSVPGALDAAPKRLTVTAVLPDGDFRRVRLIYNPATGAIHPR